MRYTQIETTDTQGNKEIINVFPCNEQAYLNGCLRVKLAKKTNAGLATQTIHHTIAESLQNCVNEEIEKGWFITENLIALTTAKVN